jgi:hypothetical protein
MGRGPLSNLSLLVLFFAVLCFQSVVSVLFYLLSNDFLRRTSGRLLIKVKICLTDADTPDFFSTSISSAVKGLTNSPSLINSLVASVSSLGH